MGVLVALLRGINVGGAGKLPMAQLRDIVSSCGHTDVATYIQSGNVVFRSAATDTRAVADELRAATRDATDLDPEVHVRTLDELAAVVEANPFVARADEPKQLHVTFLGRQPDAIDLDPAAFEPERWALGDGVVYLYLPDGIGRSKLATELARRTTASGTTRNWRTTTKLLAMAREIS